MLDVIVVQTPIFQQSRRDDKRSKMIKSSMNEASQERPHRPHRPEIYSPNPLGPGFQVHIILGLDVSNRAIRITDRMILNR